MQDSGATAMAPREAGAAQKSDVDLTAAGPKEALARAEEKPLGELLSDLSRELSELVHDEVQLAKLELTEKAKKMGEGSALLAGAAVAGFLGLGALATCAVAALALVVSLWLAALIVAAVLLGAAGVTALAGLGQLQKGAPPVPEQALESSKEDVAWLQEQLKSARQ
jgi:hypothetical protein